ncbi:MAG: hypothetical protein AMXMBFR13_19280, partial [Phycisphaerae bacterium]
MITTTGGRNSSTPPWMPSMPVGVRLIFSR